MGVFKTGKVTGIPIPAKELGQGKAFFVGNSTANNDTDQGVDEVTSYGSNANRPFATTDYALNQCVDNRGDEIHILEGHAENIASSGSLVPDVAGVSVIGHGRGANRPTFTYTAAGGTIAITGAGTRISNCIFQAGATGTNVEVTLGVNIIAADVEFDNNQMRDGGSSSFFVIMQGLGSTAFSASRVQIENNDFYCIQGGSSGTTLGIRLSGSSAAANLDSENMRIAFNKFVGQFDNAAIYSQSSGTGHTGLELSHNTIYNKGLASGSHAIDINNAITGIADHNNMAMLGSTNVLTNVFDPGSLLCIENYGVNSINETGTLLPASASASC